MDDHAANDARAAGRASQLLARRLLLLLALTTIVAGAGCASSAPGRLRHLRAENACLDHRPSPDVVAYEEGPSRLVAPPPNACAVLRNEYGVSWCARPASEVVQVMEDDGDANWLSEGAVLFWGRLREPGQAARLVVVVRQAKEPLRSGFRSPIAVFLFRPTGAGEPCRSFCQNGRVPNAPPAGLTDSQHVFRFFVGQSDPGDPSHFTIGYCVGDKRGWLDGWLRGEHVDFWFRGVQDAGQDAAKSPPSRGAAS